MRCESHLLFMSRCEFFFFFFFYCSNANDLRKYYCCQRWIFTSNKKKSFLFCVFRYINIYCLWAEIYEPTKYIFFRFSCAGICEIKLRTIEQNALIMLCFDWNDSNVTYQHKIDCYIYGKVFVYCQKLYFAF